ncbi:MAG: STAS domain-containing protein [Acidimicrobiia bacterium]
MEGGPQTFGASWEWQDDTVRVRLVGELDLGTVEQLRQVLSKAETRGTELVIDLRSLTFIDSSGLHELVQARQRYEQRGGRLTLVRGSPAVQRILSVSKLHQYFDFAEPD